MAAMPDTNPAPMIRLLPYQRQWIKDQSRFKAGMMSRQSGKTFSATLEIVDRVIEAATKGQREDWIILSRGERQAQEALNEGIKKHLQAYKFVFDSKDSYWVGADATYRAIEVELQNGSKITALPANPDTARGFSRNVLLDEFAFHFDSRKIWAAVFPVVTRGNKMLRVVSTPNGKGNKFYEIMTDTTGQWSLHSVNIHEAIAQGLRVNADELRRALGDDEAWTREYELSWLDDSTAWLPIDLINAAECDEAGDPGRFTGGPIFIGNDIGRKNDLWVSAVIESVGDVFFLRELSVKKNASFSEHDAELDRLITKYNPLRVCMDATGLGMKPVEDAVNKYGSSRIEGVTFTTASKHTMAVNARRIFEDRKIRIPINEALRRDLYKLKKDVSPTGAPRYDAASDKEGHADRTWALFLAFYAALRTGAPIEFSATGKLRNSNFAFAGDMDQIVSASNNGFGVVAGGYSTEGF